MKQNKNIVRNIFVGLMLVFYSFTATAQEITMLVAGSKTGSRNHTAQLMLADSKANLIKGFELNVVSPGKVCKAHELVPSYVNDTPVLVLNLSRYAAAIEAGSASCDLYDIKKGYPVMSQVILNYFLSNTGLTTKDMHERPLKIGYAKNYQILKNWHKLIVEATGQPHQFVAYKGSGNLKKGLYSGEIDVGVFNQLRAVKMVKDDNASVLYTSEKTSDGYASLTDLDPALGRNQTETLFLFGGNKRMAKKIAKRLKANYENANGEWANYVLTSGVPHYFGKSKEADFQSAVDSWLQK